MSAWADPKDAWVDRYIRQLALQHPRSALVYARELRRFERFLLTRGSALELTVEDVTHWLLDCARLWPEYLVIDRACKVERYLRFLVSQGRLTGQPFEHLQSRYGLQTVTSIVRALLSDQREAALEAARRPMRFGSFLGPMMQEHIALMRSMGYRYRTQAERLAAFDRFLQGRPELTAQSLPMLVRTWADTIPTLEHRWRCQLLGRDLTRAWRRIDPSIEGVGGNRDLRRQMALHRRQPYIYTPQEVQRLLTAAQGLPSPRAPLRPLTAYTMLVLAYCAGLRQSELLGLELGDLHWGDGTIHIRDTKFFKSRRLPLSHTALAALREYLEARSRAGGPQRSTAPLFWRQTRHGGGRYSRTTAQGILVSVLRRSGLKPLPGKQGPRIHDLRHAFVCHRILAWHRDGIDPDTQMPYLSTYLGHKDMNSTLLYLTVTQELLQLAGERFRAYALGSINALHGRMS